MCEVALTHAHFVKPTNARTHARAHTFLSPKLRQCDRPGHRRNHNQVPTQKSSSLCICASLDFLALFGQLGCQSPVHHHPRTLFGVVILYIIFISVAGSVYVFCCRLFLLGRILFSTSTLNLLNSSIIIFVVVVSSSSVVVASHFSIDCDTNSVTQKR